MKIDILTLFPNIVMTVLSESIIGRAMTKGIIEINCVNIRDFSIDKHKRVDDYPYGGSQGMVMAPQPIYDAYASVRCDNSHCIYLTPQGKTFNQAKAITLADYPHLILLCGHYEGVDERVIEEIVDEEISVGDFVLTGGEIPAMLLCDSICRLVPGVLSSEEAFTQESHFNGMLEYPLYTHPRYFKGRAVPDVLLSGHHAKIEKWRKQKSLLRTKTKRPDLLTPRNSTHE